MTRTPKHDLGGSSLSESLTGARMLTEREIVEGSEFTFEMCGVYFLIKGESVVYVGQSVNIAARLRDHQADKDFDSYSWIQCPRESLDVMESLYIHVLRPPLNHDGGRVEYGRLRAPMALDRLIRNATGTKDLT